MQYVKRLNENNAIENQERVTGSMRCEVKESEKNNNNNREYDTLLPADSVSKSACPV